MENSTFSNFADYLSKPIGNNILDLSNATLLECIEEMIKVKDAVSVNYRKHHSCLIHNLKNIETEFGCTLTPMHVTDIFWNYFISYLINKRNLSLSTVKTVSSQLKTAIQWAARHNAKVSDTYDILKIPPYCHEQIALTPDEVSHIYHFDISSIRSRKQHHRTLERVKDMFVLSCNLGQRFSDMTRIDKSCFDRNIFTILQQKTGTYARVDIEKMSLDRNTTYKILDKYGYKSPLTTDISCYDRYLKMLLKNIGKEFSCDVKREKKINGIVETNFYPKYRLICSHTARRTFITNNVMKGYSSLEIMRASGHKTYSSFEKYLCYFND